MDDYIVDTMLEQLIHHYEYENLLIHDILIVLLIQMYHHHHHHHHHHQVDEMIVEVEIVEIIKIYICQI